MRLYEERPDPICHIHPLTLHTYTARVRITTSHRYTGPTAISPRLCSMAQRGAAGNLLGVFCARVPLCM